MADRIQQAGARIFGIGVCALLAVVACSPKTRDVEHGGSGGVGPAGGHGGTGTTGSTGGTGGASCQNSDPECECAGEQVVARDADKDGHGSQACKAKPGDDCDDTDPNFVVNDCGGCNKDLGGKVGDPCLECGVFTCNGTAAVACISPSPTPQQCLGKSTIQVCEKGNWVTLQTCSGNLSYCANAVCTECAPGMHKCDHVLSVDVVISCSPNGTWGSSWTSCWTPSWKCSAASGQCVELFHPRDLDFDVPRLLRDPMGDPPPGLRTRDVLDAAIGIAFG